MSRILLLLLLVVLLLLIWRPARERIQPHVQEFVLDPVYEWNTRNEVKEIVREVERARTLGAELPPPAEFADFLHERTMGRRDGRDPWGNEYYLLRDRRTWQVGSAGRDLRPGTEDDVRSEPQPL